MDTFDNNDFPQEPLEKEPLAQAEEVCDIPALEADPVEVPVEPNVQAEAAVQEPAPVEPPVRDTSYHYSGNGRRESPYANSPYVMNHTNTQEGYHFQNHYEPPKKPKARKAKTGFWKKAAAAALALALVAGSCAVTASVVNRRWEDRATAMENRFYQEIDRLQQQINTNSNQSTGNSVSGSPVASDGGLTPGQVYARNLDAVVAISCTVSNGYSQGTSRGSGFIISQEGYVITNHHVIDGAVKINVVLNDGTELDAELVGSDSINDLAVLKTQGADLPCVTIGSSSNLVVGDQVVAIGNPLGELTSTMTVGYVSGKDRTVTTDGNTINMLQTDAAINPGNSGGPLFNMKGEVVGITTAKYSGTTSSGATIEGIGFAVPIDDVLDEIADLIEVGYIRGGYLGVMVKDMSTETATVYNLPVGAYVISVDAGGSADRAGIHPEDIILALGDYTVSNISDLTKALRKFEAGETTTVTVFRRGAEITLDITLDEKPQETVETQTVPETVPEETQSEKDSMQDFFDWFFGGW